MNRAAILLLLAAAPVRSADRPDILIADFEGDTYGDWTAEGEAFGPGPAAGTLPGQMPVTGFLGNRLVNSFFHGDKSTGTLTAPPVRVERKYINFLVGGGGHQGKTCVNLLHDGKVVRTAAGPNTEPGGSERLDWYTWDVAEFAGKSVVFQIVDRHTGGWGHISADHFVQSDARKQAEPASREVAVTSRYLHLPVKTGAAKRRMKLVVDGSTAREFEIELADGGPSFWAFADVTAFQGKKLRIAVDALPAGSKALDAITQGDDIKGAEPVYNEKGRPQFHFTSRRGWLNDPNGLVYHAGEWHLFYQHNPYGWNWGNMHWGHAVSRDLVRWEELPVALYPKKFGDWAFSGSAVVDKANKSGFKAGAEDVLVLAYTSTGRGECVAYSIDRGRTWTEYAGNPVVKHRGRDPKLVWHQPTNRWVMAVYDEHDNKQWIAFYTSPDLKVWTFRSRIEGFFECPDLFELPVDGGRAKARWVLYAADGKYVTGDFDGATFKPDGGKRQVWYGDYYAAQTYDNAPDGRRVQVGWGRGVTFPGRPFNQQMTVPVELKLRTTPDGVRLFADPVPELEALRGNRLALPGGGRWKAITFASDGRLFDIDAEFDPAGAETVGVTVRGIEVAYDVARGRLTCGKHTAPLAPDGGKVRLRVLADEGSVEVFGNGGRVALSAGVEPKDTKPPVEVFTRGRGGWVTAAAAWELRSAWPAR